MSFVKRDPAPLEAAGLRWLADGGARVPRILAESPGRLELERIETGTLSPSGEEELGRMLAELHAAGAPRFGSLPAPGRFLVGRCELESPEGDDWNDYYLQHRLLPLARRVGLGAEVGGYGSKRRPSRRPGCTVTCGPATCSPDGTGGRG